MGRLEPEGLTKALPAIYVQETYLQAASVSIRGGSSSRRHVLQGKGSLIWCREHSVVKDQYHERDPHWEGP
jgi:hypothetical protein